MSIVVKDEGSKNFLNYALAITRKDLQTGERLGVLHFKLTRPFMPAPTTGDQDLGRVIQGAAGGSEAILQE